MSINPDGQHRNQTDYILCSQRWRSFIQSAKTRLGADCGSDHELLIAKFRLILKKVWKPLDLSVQFSSLAQSCPTLCDPMNCSMPGLLFIINPRSLPKPISIESVMASNPLILCHPLLLLPSIFPSIRVFSNESALHIRWPKYWSFSFNISPSKEHSGLISFRMHWLDLLAVQGTLKSLLQYHRSKASILRCSASFMVQLSHPHLYLFSLCLVTVPG